MNWRILIILIFSISLVFSCKTKLATPKTHILDISYPIEISKDITIVNISEYLNSNIKLIKASIGENISCSISQDSNSLILKTTNFIAPISNLHLQTNKGKFDILVKNTNFKASKKQAPHIYGDKIEDNQITFTINNKIDSLFIYINNKLIDNSYLDNEEGIYTLNIPSSISDLEQSLLRIYAYSNESGPSNEFAVPLASGRAIDIVESIDSTYSLDTLIQVNFKDEGYINLYKEAINTFIYSKTTSEDLDSLIKNDISKYGQYRLINQTTAKKNYTLNYSELSDINNNLSSILYSYKKPRTNSRSINNINQLNAFLMTIPGPPSFYLRPDDSNIYTSALEFSFNKIENLRKVDLPLIYGSYETVRNDDLTYAFVRKYFDQFTMVIFNKSKFMKRRKINLHTSFSNAEANAIFKSKFDITKGKLLIELQPYSVEIITGKIID